MSAARPTVLFFVAVDWFFCSHFLERAVAAKNAGYDVVVLTKVMQHGAVIEAAGLRLIPLEMDRRSMNPLAGLASLRHVLQVYRREQPSLLHQVALKPILLGSLAARIAGITHVVNAVVGGGYAFTSKQLSMRLLRPFLQAALRALLNPPGSKVVFENADDLGAFVREKQVRAEDAALIRGAGVEPALFPAAAYRNDIPVVILAARLLWDKGVGEFVEAARILKARQRAVRFVVVGGADPENRASISAETLEAWRREGVVELWGFRSDMPVVLAQGAIACLPSYREGLPKSLLEAMAAGLPCVTTDVPGCREAVRDGDNGLLVPARDAVALANALDTLITDNGLRERMGLRGRERIDLEFSSARVIAQTLALYKEVLTQ